MAMTFHVRDGGGSTEMFEVEDVGELKEAIHEWAAGGVWSDLTGERYRATVWVKTYYEEVADEDDDDNFEPIEGSYLVTLDPDEPDCTEDEHDWQAAKGGCAENPGVWGHGGGVEIHEHCPHCGWRKVIDTWATNPETGEQGLSAVIYHKEKAETLDG